MTQTKTNDPATPSQQRTVLLAVDLKNSVLAEVDAGNTNRIAYSPYGHQSAQQEVASQLGFNGERRETTPGWYFLGNGYRVYNPRLMRFHSPDNMSPFGKGGLNAYMYCGGEPVMNSDPTGHHFGWPSVVMQKFIGGLRTAINRTTSVATTSASRAASNIGSVISTISGGTSRAKKAVSMFAAQKTGTTQTVPQQLMPLHAHTATTGTSTISRLQPSPPRTLVLQRPTYRSQQRLQQASKDARKQLSDERKFVAIKHAEEIRNQRLAEIKRHLGD